VRAALKRLSAVAAFLRSIGLAEAAAHAEDAALDGETLVHTLAKPDAAVIVRPRRKRVADAPPPRRYNRVAAALPPRCRVVDALSTRCLRPTAPQRCSQRTLQPGVRGACRHVVLPELHRSAI
jgi:hypothetical protein